MNTLKIFGWLSHFLWVTMLLLCIFFGLLVYSDFSNTDHQTWLIQFMGKEVSNDENTVYFRVFSLISYITYLLYFYAITLFNLCVRLFEKRIFFDEKIIKRLKKIGLILITNLIIVFLLGKLFVIRSERIIKRFKKIGLSFITNFIIVFLLGKLFVIHSEKVIQASTNFSSQILTKLEAPLGSLILAFFFLVLSQVFKEA